MSCKEEWLKNKPLPNKLQQQESIVKGTQYTDKYHKEVILPVNGRRKKKERINSYIIYNLTKNIYSLERLCTRYLTNAQTVLYALE